MSIFKPKITLSEDRAAFEFGLNGSPLLASDALDFLEETANQSDESWLFIKEGRNVTIYFGDGTSTCLEAGIYHLFLPETNPVKLLAWLPQAVVGLVLGSGYDIPVYIEKTDALTTYSRLRNEANRV